MKHVLQIVLLGIRRKGLKELLRTHVNLVCVLLGHKQNLSENLSAVEVKALVRLRAKNFCNIPLPYLQRFCNGTHVLRGFLWFNLLLGVSKLVFELSYLSYNQVWGLVKIVGRQEIYYSLDITHPELVPLKPATQYLLVFSFPCFFTAQTLGICHISGLLMRSLNRRPGVSRGRDHNLVWHVLKPN